MGEYVPSAGGGSRLSGMGGVYNTKNLHTYHYANNNPVKYIDPNGRTANETKDLLFRPWSNAANPRDLLHRPERDGRYGISPVMGGVIIQSIPRIIQNIARYEPQIRAGLEALKITIITFGAWAVGKVVGEYVLESSPRKDESETAGIIGVSEEEFHRPGGTKETIIDQHQNELKDIGAPKNPDILIDKNGKIGFRNRITGEETWTDTPAEWYGSGK
jgi:hypothetical protein